MRSIHVPALAALSLSAVAAPALHAQDSPPPQYAMDYGPVVSGTFRVDDGDNVVPKGRWIRLGESAGVLFDTELLRVAAATVEGGAKLVGTAYDGAHGAIPELGEPYVVHSRREPGWAHAGSLADPRPTPDGPLPRAHGRFGAMFLHGREVLLKYEVAGTTVTEHFDLVRAGGAGAIARSLNIGGGPAPMTMVLGTAAGEATARADRVVFRRSLPPLAGIEIMRHRGAWEDLRVGAPSADDLASAAGLKVRWLDGFARPDGAVVRAEEASMPAAELPALTDGEAASDRDQPERCVFFDGGAGRLWMDMQSVQPVTRITVYSWHRRERAAQHWTLYGRADDATTGADAEDPTRDGWTRIAVVDSKDQGEGGKHVVSIGTRGEELGAFRHLLWVVESPGEGNSGTFLTEIDVFTRDQPAPVDTAPTELATVFRLLDAPTGAKLRVDDERRVLLDLPPRSLPVRVKTMHWDGAVEDLAVVEELAGVAGPGTVLSRLTSGGAVLWPQILTTKGTMGSADGAFAVDTVTVPEENPWNSRLRFGAFDFLDADRAALSTWNGDVWIVSGLAGDWSELRWKRFATGLHDPLGLKVVDGVIHTHGRDQITQLFDHDGNGEADEYRTFNNEVLVTRNFHEFAFDLQTDAAGNFYFSKGGPVRPGGRGFDRITPHHGVVFKLSPDGKELTTIATGLRAPNGIGVSPDGSIVTSGDNEGTWMPRCRIHWIRSGVPYYGGVQDTAHRDVVPEIYDDPLCFLPMDVDNSSGGQVWVPQGSWGELGGRMLHLSYGQCRLYLTLVDEQGDRVQGGVVALPASFASSLMRGRFHPEDGQLYVVGLKGWQTRAGMLTAFQRVRRTDEPLRLPIDMKVVAGGVQLTFSTPLDRELVEDLESWSVQRWNYKYSEAYGSAEYSLIDPEKEVKRGTENRDPVKVLSASLSEDGRTVTLGLEDMRRVMQMRIAYDLDAADGAGVRGEVHLTVNFVPGAAGGR